MAGPANPAGVAYAPRAAADLPRWSQYEAMNEVVRLARMLVGRGPDALCDQA